MTRPLETGEGMVHSGAESASIPTAQAAGAPPQFLHYEDGEFNGNAPELNVWWLTNLEADTASLKPGAPQYLKDQLASRQGRNGRGRLWVAPEFGALHLPRYAGKDDKADFLPGGIVIHPRDGRFCVGGHVAAEDLQEAGGDASPSAVGISRSEVSPKTPSPDQPQ